MKGRPIARVARVLGMTIVTPVLVAACAVTPAGQPAAMVTVQTAPVAKSTISGSIVYSGDVQSRSQVNVLPKIAGQITVLKVDVGSQVKKGDVIAEIDHATLDAQVAQAKATVALAKAKLETIDAGSRSETIAQAKANLQAAQAKLAFMKSGGRPQDIQAATGNLDTAEARLQSLEQGRPQAITQAKANLAAAQARLQQLKDGPTNEQIQAAELGVEQAKDESYAANVQKDAACNPAYPAAQCNAAQAAAAAASTAVNQANAQLKVLTAPPTTQQVNEAQAAVTAAEAQLQIAEKPGSSADLSAAQGAVTASQAQLDLAKSPYSSADLAGAQAAVDVAQQQLKLAENPYTKQDKDAANAAVQQAEAALQMATVQQSDAIIKAPINGVVAQRFVSVGAMASPQSPIVSLIDPRVDVVVNVDQNHAASIKKGDPATITADALPGVSIPADVTTVAPALDPTTRTLQIKVTPKQQNPALKDGLLARVTFVTATHKGAIVVPANAIIQRNGQSTVYVVVNGQASPHVVQTGLTDGTHTEIVSGLKVGDVIVVSGQDQLVGTEAVTVQK